MTLNRETPGFTLIELLVAIFITVVVMLITSAVVKDLVQIRGKVEEKAFYDTCARTALVMTRRDMAGADRFLKWKENGYQPGLMPDELPRLSDVEGQFPEMRNSYDFSVLLPREVYGAENESYFQGDKNFYDCKVMTMRCNADTYEAGPTSSIYVRWFVYDPDPDDREPGMLYREVVKKVPDPEAELNDLKGERNRFWDPARDGLVTDPYNVETDAVNKEVQLDRYIVAKYVPGFEVRLFMLKVKDGKRTLTAATDGDSDLHIPGTFPVEGDHRYFLEEDPNEAGRGIVRALEISVFVDVGAPGAGEVKIHAFQRLVPLSSALLSSMDGELIE